MVGGERQPPVDVGKGLLQREQGAAVQVRQARVAVRPAQDPRTNRNSRHRSARTAISYPGVAGRELAQDVVQQAVDALGGEQRVLKALAALRARLRPRPEPEVGQQQLHLVDRVLGVEQGLRRELDDLVLVFPRGAGARVVDLVGVDEHHVPRAEGRQRPAGEQLEPALAAVEYLELLVHVRVHDRLAPKGGLQLAFEQILDVLGRPSRLAINLHALPLRAKN